MTITYVREYIKAALNQDELTEPDLKQAGNEAEVLISLHDAHRLGGKESAFTAWNTIILHRPELAKYVPQVESINLRVSKIDAWALRRILSMLPVDPSVQTSPFVKLLIRAFSRLEIERFVRASTALSEDVLKVNPKEPPSSMSDQALLIPFAELEDLPLPPYAIDRYPIYEQGINLIYGLPGLGKSFIAIDFMGHIAVKNPEKLIIYAAPEGWSSVPMRWKAWCQRYGVNPSNTLLMRQSLRVTREEQVAHFKSEIDALGAPIHFIVFDTLARAMVGDNENDTREMAQFVEALDSLRNALDCGILLIHHVNKMGTLRGSTVLDGALDSIIKVQKDNGQIILHNQQEKGGKNRHRPEADPIYLTLNTVEVTMRGEVDSAGVIELVSKGEAQSEESSLTPRKRKLLEVLDSYDEGANIPQLTEITGIPSSTIYRLVDQLGVAGLVIRDKISERITITQDGRTASRR